MKIPISEKIRTEKGIVTVRITNLDLETLSENPLPEDVISVEGVIVFKGDVVADFHLMEDTVMIVPRFIIHTSNGKPNGKTSTVPGWVEISSFESNIERTIDDLIALHIANIPCL